MSRPVDDRRGDGVAIGSMTARAPEAGSCGASSSGRVELARRSRCGTRAELLLETRSASRSTPGAPRSGSSSCARRPLLPVAPSVAPRRRVHDGRTAEVARDHGRRLPRGQRSVRSARARLAASGRALPGPIRVVATRGCGSEASSRAPVALEARRNSAQRCRSSSSPIAPAARESAASARRNPRLGSCSHGTGPARASRSGAARRGRGGSRCGRRRTPRRRGRRPGRPRRARPTPARTPGGPRRPRRGPRRRPAARAAGSSGRWVGGMPSRSELTGGLSGRGVEVLVERREHAVRGERSQRRVLHSRRSWFGEPPTGSAPWVPAERRFSQASTTRAAMPASASLPQARGSYCFLLPTSPSIFSTPS